MEKEKGQVIKNDKEQRTKGDLQSFLGLANYYTNYMARYYGMKDKKRSLLINFRLLRTDLEL